MNNNEVIYKLAEDWCAAGIMEGDMMLLHSSPLGTLQRISRMGVKATPDLIINSFLQALGSSGTLLLPLFNFDFTKGVAFDIRSTPSHMGSLTEAGRLWVGAIRTGHPIYSFAVIGRQADIFHGLKNFSGYGHDSPFGILHRLGGKIGVLDLPEQTSMTFYHYIEECHEVPYRYHKIFTGPYINSDGVESTESFSCFVRKLEDGVITHVNPMGEILWEKGLYTGFRPNEGCSLRVISASSLFDEVAIVLNEGRAKGLLYEIE